MQLPEWTAVRGAIVQYLVKGHAVSGGSPVKDFLQPALGSLQYLPRFELSWGASNLRRRRSCPIQEVTVKVMDGCGVEP